MPMENQGESEAILNAVWQKKRIQDRLDRDVARQMSHRIIQATETPERRHNRQDIRQHLIRKKEQRGIDPSFNYSDKRDKGRVSVDDYPLAETFGSRSNILTTRPKSAIHRRIAASDQKRPQSADRSKFASEAEFLQHKKWADMVHRAPDFRDKHLRELEAETSALLRGALNLSKNSEKPNSRPKIAKKKSKKVPRGGGLQAARANKQAHSQPELRLQDVTTAASSTPKSSTTQKKSENLRRRRHKAERRIYYFCCKHYLQKKRNELLCSIAGRGGGYAGSLAAFPLDEDVPWDPKASSHKKENDSKKSGRKTRKKTSRRGVLKKTRLLEIEENYDCTFEAWSSPEKKPIVSSDEEAEYASSFEAQSSPEKGRAPDSEVDEYDSAFEDYSPEKRESIRLHSNGESCGTSSFQHRFAEARKTAHFVSSNSTPAFTKTTLSTQIANDQTARRTEAAISIQKVYRGNQDRAKLQAQPKRENRIISQAIDREEPIVNNAVEVNQAESNSCKKQTRKVKSKSSARKKKKDQAKAINNLAQPKHLVDHKRTDEPEKEAQRKLKVATLPRSKVFEKHKEPSVPLVVQEASPVVEKINKVEQANLKQPELTSPEKSPRRDIPENYENAFSSPEKKPKYFSEAEEYASSFDVPSSPEKGYLSKSEFGDYDSAFEGSSPEKANGRSRHKMSPARRISGLQAKESSRLNRELQTSVPVPKVAQLKQQKDQEGAATSIQKLYRGTRDRAAVASRKKEKEKHFIEAGAATSIQKLYRGQRDRTAVASVRERASLEEAEAATSIQKVYRGKRTRAQNQEKQRAQQEYEKDVEAHNWRRGAAAIKIQRQYSAFMRRQMILAGLQLFLDDKRREARKQKKKKKGREKESPKREPKSSLDTPLTAGEPDVLVPHESKVDPSMSQASATLKMKTSSVPKPEPSSRDREIKDKDTCFTRQNAAAKTIQSQYRVYTRRIMLLDGLHMFLKAKRKEQRKEARNTKKHEISDLKQERPAQVLNASECVGSADTLGIDSQAPDAEPCEKVVMKKKDLCARQIQKQFRVYMQRIVLLDGLQMFLKDERKKARKKEREKKKPVKSDDELNPTAVDEASSIVESSANSTEEAHKLRKETEKAEKDRREAAARRIQKQYEVYIRRAMILEGLQMFLDEKRREAKKKARLKSRESEPSKTREAPEHIKLDVPSSNPSPEANTKDTNSQDSVTVAHSKEVPIANTSTTSSEKNSSEAQKGSNDDDEDEESGSEEEENEPSEVAEPHTSRQQELPNTVNAHEDEDEDEESESEEESEAGDPVIDMSMPGDASVEDSGSEEEEESESEEDEEENQHDPLAMNAALDHDASMYNAQCNISAWTKSRDLASGKSFYYNEQTGVSQWENPNPPATTTTSVHQTWGLRRQNSIRVGQASGDWEICRDETTGDNFYYNKRTQECQWTIPDALAGSQRYDDPTQKWDLRRSNSVRSTTSGNWQRHEDAASMRSFYYNIETGESTWDRPSEFQVPVMQEGEESGGWVCYYDYSSNRYYYFEKQTGECVWDMPESVLTALLYNHKKVVPQLECIADDQDDDYAIAIGDDFANLGV